MVKLNAPEQIVVGESFRFGFESDERVAGRLRITAGRDAIPFVLERPDREPVKDTHHRIRGRSGTFQISDWGEHEAGSELVLRFEGAKLWLKVAAPDGAPR